ncbi:hypothetical protein ACMYR3_15250 [Ampullimonas aquatilis]|uniref:hypothetical protein n=1 Tax=Ampullimonas aquatilis TaxID=1341549 RepID=UPI003C7320C2
MKTIELEYDQMVVGDDADDPMVAQSGSGKKMRGGVCRYLIGRMSSMAVLFRDRAVQLKLLIREESRAAMGNKLRAGGAGVACPPIFGQQGVGAML